jgi:hypothetical protein
MANRSGTVELDGVQTERCSKEGRKEGTKQKERKENNETKRNGERNI